MKFKWLIGLLAITFAAFVVACNRSGDITTLPSSDESSYSSEASTTPSSAPALVTTPATGVTVTVLQSTFSADRCTRLDQLPNSVDKLIHKVQIENNLPGSIHSAPALYHSDAAGCGATQDNQGGVGNIVTGDKELTAGKTGTTTYTFRIFPNMCGRYQLDDTWRGEADVFVIGKVIDTGRDCPDCSLYDLKLFVTGEGLTRTVKVTFANLPAGKKADINFGDGNSAQLGNNESTQHTWVYGTFTVTASLIVGDLDPCLASATVSNQDGCENYQAPAITGDISSNKQPTQVVFDKGTVAPNGGSFNPVLPQSVARPLYGQPAGSFSTTYSLSYGPAQLHCEVNKTFTKPVPPQDCVKVTRWTLKNKQSGGPKTLVVSTDRHNPAGSLIVPNGEFVLGANQSTTFTGYSSTTLYAFFKLPKFKTVNTYWYDGESNFEDDCLADGGTFYENKDGRHNVCATRNNHGSKWNYDPSKQASRYKTTNEQIPDGYKYDWADSELSGACGPSGFSAQCGGGASLKAECVCPLD